MGPVRLRDVDEAQMRTGPGRQGPRRQGRDHARRQRRRRRAGLLMAAPAEIHLRHRVRRRPTDRRERPQRRARSAAKGRRRGEPGLSRRLRRRAARGRRRKATVAPRSRSRQIGAGDAGRSRRALCRHRSATCETEAVRGRASPSARKLASELIAPEPLGEIAAASATGSRIWRRRRIWSVPARRIASATPRARPSRAGWPRRSRLRGPRA